MNLLLLHPEDFAADGTALLTGRRAEHAHEVLKAQRGDTVRVGRRGGQRGTATVIESSASSLRLRVELDDAAPPRPGISILLAVPRPKAVKKIVPACAALGIDRLVLVNAAKVEKSYFTSKVLEPAFLDGLCDLGLEQAQDTVAPRVELRERFRPFVEDELPTLSQGHQKCLAHPQPKPSMPSTGAKHTWLAIGPEGGWVDFELALLERVGFERFSLGPRTLRVEVALPALVGSLLPTSPYR